jgi:hypothetical protein
MGSGGIASATLNLQKLLQCLVLFYYKIYKSRISETKTAFQIFNDAELVDTRTSCNPTSADPQLPVINNRYNGIMRVHMWTTHASPTAANTFGPSYRQQ